MLKEEMELIHLPLGVIPNLSTVNSLFLDFGMGFAVLLLRKNFWV